MVSKLVGVKRGIFQNQDGQEIRFGHLFVVYDFDNPNEDCVGQEAGKVKFDYDGASELIELGLILPCDIDLQFNSKGKCIKVELVSKDKK